MLCGCGTFVVCFHYVLFRHLFRPQIWGADCPLRVNCKCVCVCVCVCVHIYKFEELIARVESIVGVCVIVYNLMCILHTYQHTHINCMHYINYIPIIHTRTNTSTHTCTHTHTHASTHFHCLDSTTHLSTLSTALLFLEPIFYEKNGNGPIFYKKNGPKK